MFKLFLVVLLGVFTLTGCASNIKPEQPVIKVMPVLPQDTLLISCHVTPPPVTKEDYLKLDADKKESALTDLVISLYGDLESCNKQLKGLRKWKLEIENQFKP